MNDDSSERLERIESNLAHLERQVEELNQIIIEQGRTIRRLTTQQQRLSESVENAELDRIRATNPKPPHYQ